MASLAMGQAHGGRGAATVTLAANRASDRHKAFHAIRNFPPIDNLIVATLTKRRTEEQEKAPRMQSPGVRV